MMQRKHLKILEGLRRKGLRLTPQREMILSAVAKGNHHCSADQLMTLVRKRYPYLNKSVIYRNLELLTRLGILNQADFGKGYMEYELHAHPHHHHLVCENCGKTAEIGEKLLLPLYKKLQKKYQFVPSLQYHAISGLCKKCLNSSDSHN